MGYKCPYCGEVTPSQTDFHREEDVYYREDGIPLAQLICMMNKCAACNKISVYIVGTRNYWDSDIYYRYPPIDVCPLPEYIPHAIKSDYIEACSILNLSPKAAATLARRCLQGMIHDYHGIHQKNLNAEITALKDRVTPIQWKAIDALRKIGNIGAHMEADVNSIVDVDPDEAEKMLKLIELLIDKWYVARHDEEVLLQKIISIGTEKEAQRSKND